MGLFIQQLVNGLSVGSIYALMAVGYSLIYSLLNFTNFAHSITVTIGAFCALLALIGIANVFSNTLGFVRQRKREFARYLSVGMTPAGMRKMFFVEALVIAGRPALITLPLTALFAGFMIQASYLDPAEFLE